MNIRVLMAAFSFLVVTVASAHDFGDETIAFYPFTDGAAGTSAIGVPLKNLINPDVLAGRVENKGYGKCTFSSECPGRYVFTNLAYGAGCVYENPGSLYFTTQTGVGKSSDAHHAEVWFDDLCKEALKLGAYKIEFFYKLADDMASVNTDTATFCGGWKNGSYTDYWLGWQILQFGSPTTQSQRLQQCSRITSGGMRSATNAGIYTYPEIGSHKDGKWHHVAVAYPFATKYVKWINDGEQVAGGCRQDISSWTDGEPDLVRPFILNRGSGFRGWISCVRLSRHNPNDYKPLRVSDSATCVPLSDGTDTYEEIEFIAANGTQYVDTGVVGQEGLSAEVTFMYTRDTSRCILGASDGRGGEMALPRPKDAAIKVKYTVATAFPTTASGKSLYLFARNAEGSVTDLAFARIYAARISAGKTVLRDYLPCRRVSDGICGLFDLVHGKFSPAQGGKPFFIPWRVGVYGGKGATGSMFTWFRLVDRSPECDLVNLTPALAQSGEVFSTLDQVVMPGGSSLDEYDSLGATGRSNLKDYLKKGGCYYGTCAGSHLMLEDLMGISGYKTVGYEDVDKRTNIRFNTEGLRELGLTQEVWNVTYNKGPFITNGTLVAGADIHVWGAYTNTSGRVSTTGLPMEGRFAFLGGTYYDGRIILTSSHPEYRSETSPDVTLLVQQGFRWLSGRKDIEIGDYTDEPDSDRMSVFLDRSYSGLGEIVDTLLRINNDPRMNLVYGATDVQLKDARYKAHGKAIIMPKGVVGVEGSGGTATKSEVKALKARGGLCLFEDDGLSPEDVWTIVNGLARDTRKDTACAWDSGCTQTFLGDQTFTGLDLAATVSGTYVTMFLDGTIAFRPNEDLLGGDWAYRGDSVTHRVVVSNAHVSAVYGNHRRDSYCTATTAGLYTPVARHQFEFTLGSRNTAGGVAVLTFEKELCLNGKSTLSVDARGKGAGVYRLIEAKTLSCSARTFCGTAEIKVDEGLHGMVAKDGSVISLVVTSDAPSGEYTGADYVQDGLVAMWDCASGVSLDAWADVAGGHPFAFTGEVYRRSDGGVTFGGGKTDYATLSEADTLSTFGASANGTMEIVYRRATTTSSMFLLQSSKQAGMAAVVAYDGRGFYGHGKETTANYDYGVATTNLCTLSSAYQAGEPVTPVWFDGQRSFCSSLAITGGYWSNASGGVTTLGGRNSHSGNHFNGTIYAIRLYSRKLSAAEIDRNCFVDRCRFSGHAVARPTRKEKTTDAGSEFTLSEKGTKYTVLVYRGVGSNVFSWKVPSGVTSVDLLMVGGGGSGAAPSAANPKNTAGGGGAGGLCRAEALAVTPGDLWTIRVGEGGAAVRGGSHGINGSDSVFSNMTENVAFVALGGGAGSYGGGSGAGGAGGSGGGGTGTGAAGEALQPKSAWGGYGNDGGHPMSTAYGASGGGAGSAGRTATGLQPKGGDGLAFSITGESIEYARGGQGGVAIGLMASGGDGRDGFGDGGSAGSGAAPLSGKGGDGVVILRFTEPGPVSIEDLLACATAAEAAEKACWPVRAVELFSPVGVSDEEKKIKLVKAVAWSRANNKTAEQMVAFDLDNPGVSEKAYLFNVPESEVEEAEKSFRFLSIVPGELPSPSGVDNANGTVEVWGCEDLSADDWSPADQNHRFYRATLSK